MLGKLISVSVVAFVLVMLDLYVYQAVKIVFEGASQTWWRVINIVFWGFTGISLVGLYYYNFGNEYFFGRYSRSFLIAGIITVYFPKLFAVLFLFLDDGIRFGKWMISFFGTNSTPIENGITRSEFLSKAALISAAVPMATLSFGIISGAYDYRVRRKTITLPNLPKSFDGIQIGQLSDIHSGSFYNKTAVQGGVDLLMNEKPDVFLFTGDLVNNEATEFNNYFDVFNKIEAPLGSFSVLGNHDYGDYKSWSSIQAKKANLDLLKKAQQELGWDLLLNENRKIKVDGDEISIIGVENWGAGRFVKHGKLDQAVQGTAESPVKILMSHDPSHWEAQILPGYTDIDLTFAGHTHGMQLGIEIGDFRWSPSKYMYKQWADLYQKEQQFIYVNRGFGFIGYPGRIGILPEVTIIELKSA
jgi:predicted MPP superfamily phosphohydrolase